MTGPVEITVSGTPNPNAMKLTLNRMVSNQGKTYRDAATAAEPWAKALLAIPGIIGVFAITNFISVTKAPDVDWQDILPLAEQALKQVFE